MIIVRKPGLLLLLSGLALFQQASTTAACASPPVSITATDRTLQTREWLGRPVSTLIERWATETGLHLSVEKSLQEQKITLRLPSQYGSAATLPVVATLLQARWKLTQTDPPRWILERLPEVRKGLADQKQRAQELSDKIRQEQSVLVQKAISEGLEELNKPPRDLGEGLFGRPYLNPEPIAEPLIRLLATLSPAQRRHLATHPNTPIPMGDGGFATNRTPTLSAPLSSLSPKQQSLVHEFFSATGVTVDLKGAIVQFFNSGGTSLTGGVLLRDGSTPGDFLLGVEEGPSLKKRFADRRQGTAKATAAGSTKSKAVSDPLELLDRVYPRRASVEWQELDYAEAVQRAGALLGVPIAADFYTLSARCSFKTKNARGSEIVAAIAGAFHCAVRWQGDTLLFRSTQWPELDEREIPERLLNEWVQLKQQLRPEPASLPIDALARMTSLLRPEQTFCLADYRSREFPTVTFEWEAQVLRQDRDVLGLYAVLPEAARRKLTTTGLLVRDLAAATKPALLPLLERRAAWLLSSANNEQITLRLTPEGDSGVSTYSLTLGGAAADGGAELSFPTDIINVKVQKPGDQPTNQ